MSKDRAAPFSKKHRRYWIPVTGAMILIGLINVVLGLFSYEPPHETERIELKIPGHERAPGQLMRGEIPAAVMRAFAEKYPRTIPDGGQANGADNSISVVFPAGSTHHHAVFAQDGTFIRED